MAEIAFTDDAIDDLRRLGPDTVPKVLKKIQILRENSAAGYPLGGKLSGYRKLVVGRNTWRIVYRVLDDESVEICEVWAIGARADSQVYEAALARVRAAAQDRPEIVGLAKVIEQIGSLAGGMETDDLPVREPVPDWLAERLIYTVGLAHEEVAVLDLRQAVDLWTEFMSKPG
jgi:mRNA interferase RelE/StbE